MMVRLNLVMRITLLVCVAISAIWIVSFALYIRNQAELYLEMRPPPERVAAIAALFDAALPRDYKRVELAVGTERLTVRVFPVGTRDVTKGLASVDDAILADYRAVLGERLLSVTSSPKTGLAARLPTLSARHATGLDFRIALKTGAVLGIEARNPFILTRFGFPVGFGAGLFGTAVAFLALLVMQRETRPLRQLAAAVDNVDFTADPAPLPSARNSAPEIRAVIAAFNRLQDRLNTVLKARMALIGGISHDVRTYAARLRLRVHAIEDTLEREKAEADIRDMIRLLDDALLSSRAGAGELNRELVEFGELVADEVDDRKNQSLRVDWVAEEGSAAALVLGDRLALRRILTNLTDNALKYGNAAHLTTSLASGFFVLAVDDEGPGIPEGQRKLMMEPFSRMETSRNRGTGGAGLGLAIVRALVLAHEGGVEIAEARGGGARVIVRLPLFDPSGNGAMPA